MEILAVLGISAHISTVGIQSQSQEALLKGTKYFPSVFCVQPPSYQKQVLASSFNRILSSKLQLVCFPP